MQSNLFNLDLTVVGTVVDSDTVHRNNSREQMKQKKKKKNQQKKEEEKEHLTHCT